MKRSNPDGGVVVMVPGTQSTRSLRAVVKVLSVEPDALMTHAQLLSSLKKAGESMNRVTLYRSLERLTAANILLKVVDLHRVSRYALAIQGDGCGAHQSATRFECQVCHRQFLLRPDNGTLSSTLSQASSLGAAAGHQALEVDLSVRGICSRCVGS